MTKEAANRNWLQVAPDKEALPRAGLCSAVVEKMLKDEEDLKVTT